MTDIKKEIEDIFPQVVEWRRDFHMHPELGNTEVRTSAKVAELLRGFGLEVSTGVGSHGVVGILRGSLEGRTIALRADMDALPVQEKNTFDYVSRTDGVMHACGHDGHTAILLGTAAILSKLKDSLKGTVKFLFQPAEEVAPLGGAKPMVVAGVLEDPKVEVIFGMHIFPFIPSGTITIGKGPVTTSGDALNIEVFGKGGHGAEPHKATDTLLASCQLVNALQMVVSRMVDPQEMGILTIGKLQCGTACNIIPDYAKIEGTVRTLKEDIRERVIKGIGDISEGIGKATGTTIKVDYQKGYSAVINDPEEAERVLQTCSRQMPEGAVVFMPRSFSGSEDFSNYLVNGVKGVFICLGGGIAGQEIFNNHHPQFNWDEEAMKTGMLTFASIVQEYLG